jgi:hypothetical protein
MVFIALSLTGCASHQMILVKDGDNIIDRIECDHISYVKCDEVHYVRLDGASRVRTYKVCVDTEVQDLK